MITQTGKEQQNLLMKLLPMHHRLPETCMPCSKEQLSWNLHRGGRAAWGFTGIISGKWILPNGRTAEIDEDRP